jgi:hypothetical protein
MRPLWSGHAAGHAVRVQPESGQHGMRGRSCLSLARTPTAQQRHAEPSSNRAECGAPVAAAVSTSKFQRSLTHAGVRRARRAPTHRIHLSTCLLFRLYGVSDAQTTPPERDSSTWLRGCCVRSHLCLARQAATMSREMVRTSWAERSQTRACLPASRKLSQRTRSRPRSHGSGCLWRSRLRGYLLTWPASSAPPLAPRPVPTHG